MEMSEENKHFIPIVVPLRKQLLILCKGKAGSFSAEFLPSTQLKLAVYS
jgi:hypothetical protein